MAQVVILHSALGLQKTATERMLDAQVFRYHGVRHFFTDPLSAEYDRDASDALWERVCGCLAAVSP